MTDAKPITDYIKGFNDCISRIYVIKFCLDLHQCRATLKRTDLQTTVRKALESRIRMLEREERNAAKMRALLESRSNGQ